MPTTIARWRELIECGYDPPLRQAILSEFREVTKASAAVCEALLASWEPNIMPTDWAENSWLLRAEPRRYGWALEHNAAAFRLAAWLGSHAEEQAYLYEALNRLQPVGS